MMFRRLTLSREQRADDWDAGQRPPAETCLHLLGVGVGRLAVAVQIRGAWQRCEGTFVSGGGCADTGHGRVGFAGSDPCSVRSRLFVIVAHAGGPRWPPPHTVRGGGGTVK